MSINVNLPNCLQSVRIMWNNSPQPNKIGGRGALNFNFSKNSIDGSARFMQALFLIYKALYFLFHLIKLLIVLLCTCFGLALHLLCTCFAFALHLLCTCFAPAVPYGAQLASLFLGVSAKVHKLTPSETLLMFCMVSAITCTSIFNASAKDEVINFVNGDAQDVNAHKDA